MRPSSENANGELGNSLDAHATPNARLREKRESRTRATRVDARLFANASDEVRRSTSVARALARAGHGGRRPGAPNVRLVGDLTYFNVFYVYEDFA